MPLIQRIGKFSPLHIGPVDLWIETDRGVTLDGNSKSSAWADQSGNGNHFSQSNATQRFLYVNGQCNGRPVLRASATSFMTGSAYKPGAYTILVVYKSTLTSGQIGSLLIWPTVSGLSYRHELLVANNLSGYTDIIFCANRAVTATPALGATPSNVNGQYNIIVQSWDGVSATLASSYSLWFNGDSKTISTTGNIGYTTSTPAQAVGNRPIEQNAQFVGDLVALLRYPVALSSNSVSQLVHAYGRKYGVSVS